MNPVLQGIEAVARAIADERTRLNNTFESLQRAATTFDPTVRLDDDGRIRELGEAARVEVGEPPASAPPEPEEPPVAASAPEPAPSPPPAKPEAEQSIEASILDYVRRMGVAVSTSSIKQALELTDAQIKHACNNLRTDHLLVRTALGLYRATTDKERAELEGETDQLAERVRQASESAEQIKGEESNGKAKRTVTVPHWTQRSMVVDSEKRKKRIFDFLVAHTDKDYVPQEIAAELGIERHNQVSEDLRDMVARGIKFTVLENHRRPAGVERGRFSNAYRVTEPVEWIDVEGKSVDPSSLEAMPV